MLLFYGRQAQIGSSKSSILGKVAIAYFVAARD